MASLHRTPERAYRQTAAYVVAWLFSTTATIFTLWIAGASLVQLVIWYGAFRSPASRQRDLLSGSDFGWTAELVVQITTFVLVCVGLAVTIWLEYHYRTGAGRGQLRRRFARVTAGQVVVVLGSLAAALAGRLLLSL